MEDMTRRKGVDGRKVVPVILAITGALFALSALPFEPSASKIALNVVAIALLAAAGAGLVVAFEGKTRQD